jgi:hypothetical protein
MVRSARAGAPELTETETGAAADERPLAFAY